MEWESFKFSVPRSFSFAKATEDRSFFVLVGLAVRRESRWPGRGDSEAQGPVFSQPDTGQNH